MWTMRSESERGVARSSREKIYYQIKFLTGDIALSFRFARAFVCSFVAILRLLLQDHLLHILFDSSAISDCSMCTNKIYISFFLLLYFIISFLSCATFVVSTEMNVYWFTVHGTNKKVFKVFVVHVCSTCFFLNTRYSFHSSSHLLYSYWIPIVYSLFWSFI